MKSFVKQGGGVVAVSLLFAVLSLGAKPGMAFGYGYGHEEPPKDDKGVVTPPTNVKKVDSSEKNRGGKKYREYKEYREKYKSGKFVYLKVQSYKKSSNPVLIREFTDRQTIYQTYRGWSKAQLEAAHISDTTLLKYLEYKQYRGYKKYKELKNDLDI